MNFSIRAESLPILRNFHAATCSAKISRRLSTSAGLSSSWLLFGFLELGGSSSDELEELDELDENGIPSGIVIPWISCWPDTSSWLIPSWCELDLSKLEISSTPFPRYHQRARSCHNTMRPAPTHSHFWTYVIFTLLGVAGVWFFVSRDLEPEQAMALSSVWISIVSVVAWTWPSPQEIRESARRQEEEEKMEEWRRERERQKFQKYQQQQRK
jgi:hypothetical protein